LRLQNRRPESMGADGSSVQILNLQSIPMEHSRLGWIVDGNQCS
jgi:hypothetical protein